MNAKHLDLARAFSTARQAANTTATETGRKMCVLLALNTSRAPWANRVMAPADIDLLEITYAGYQRQLAILVHRSLDGVLELSDDVSFSAYQGTYPAVVTHITLTLRNTPLMGVVELEKPVMLQPGECFHLVRGSLVPIRNCDWRPA